MKAVRIHGHGGPEQLVYEDAPKPIPQRGEALVRVMAAGVTPTELSWSAAYSTRDHVNRLPAIPGLPGWTELLRAARRPSRRQRQCQHDEAGQAPRGVRGGHERDGTDDPIRELRFDTFRAKILPR